MRLKKHLLLYGVISTSLLSGPAIAQTQTFEWINPAGGQFEDPANWSTQAVPSIFDVALFDLASPPLRIIANTLNVQDLLVGRNDVTLVATEANSLFQVGSLTEIGGQPSNLPNRPGRLRIDLPASAASFNHVDVGKSGFASMLALAEQTYASSVTLHLRPAATLSIELDAFVPKGPSSVRLFVKNSVSLAGGLIVGPGESSLLPPLGEEINLLYSEGGLGPNPFSSILTRPLPGRRIVVDFRDLDGDGVIELATAMIRAAETFNSPSLANERSLAASPTAIETADLNQDGLDEIITATDAGKMQIYSPTASGDLLGPFDYALGNQPSDIASGDFDSDGNIDLAISNFGDATVSIFLNPSNDPSDLFEADPLFVDGNPASLCPANLGSAGANFGPDGKDLVVVSETSGKATGYRSNDDGSFTKTAEVEVGDEPGPSSPIDDENKKDPDAPLGVGGSAAALQGEVRVGILSIVQPDSSTGLLEVIGTAFLSGIPINVASADLDADGRAEMLTVTSAGTLDITQQTNQFSTSSIQLNRPLSAIAAGNLDGEPGPEIIIATDGPSPELMILRATPDSANFGRFVLELVNVVPLTGETPAIAIGQGGTMQTGQPTLSVALKQSKMAGPSINLLGLETLPIPECNQADFNGDGIVNGYDIGSMMSAWGPCDNCPQDLSGDGVVDAQDFGLLFALWGPCTF
jgi:hypothetical protein